MGFPAYDRLLALLRISASFIGLGNHLEGGYPIISTSFLVGCSIEDNGEREYVNHFTAHANTLDPTTTKDYHNDLAEVLDALCLP
jgi:hypothetical protein